MTSISKKVFKNKLKKRVKTLDSKIQLLTIGTDWQRKNMDKAIKVNNELNINNISSELTIVGINPKSSSLLPKNIKIVGFLDKKNNKELQKLKKLYQNSHFLIHLSNAEAFGLVLNEASAHGLPIIANNIDGIKYVIRKNYSLVFDPSCNEKIIANQILQLCKNNSKYKSLSLESYYSSKLNNWNSVSRRLNKLLLNEKNIFKIILTLFVIIILLVTFVLVKSILNVKLTKKLHTPLFQTKYYGKVLKESPYKNFATQFLHPYYIFLLPGRKNKENYMIMNLYH